MQAATFAIDFLEGRSFKGFTLGEDWNGFARPYFTLDQAQRLVEAWREAGGEASYDGERNEFSFKMIAGEPDCFGSVEIEETKLYPIGAGCWIWQEVEQENFAHKD